mmetsp:Transcript_53049/g.119536  ORF Transcript_53049/g.119536 Transcript_53049/m.119536 type:complete len:327 (-) Transcript_53049:130-1110(-)
MYLRILCLGALGLICRQASALRNSQVARNSDVEIAANVESETPVTSGFVFIGIQSSLWCAQTYQSVLNLKNVGLKCRSLPPTDKYYCGIAFVGDQDAAAEVQANCSAMFDKVVTVDFNECPIKGYDPRPKKTCVRSLGKAPFTYNLQVDADTIAVSPEIETAFDVLHRGFDLTATFECCARREIVVGGKKMYPLAEDRLLHGWEMQTGVLGYVNNERTQDHANKAVEIYNSPTFPVVTSAEQQAETEALAKSDVRFMMLPPNFNMRSFTAVGFRDMPMAVAHFDYDVHKSLEEIKQDARNLVFTYTHRMAKFFSQLWDSFPHSYFD